MPRPSTPILFITESPPQILTVNRPTPMYVPGTVSPTYYLLETLALSLQVLPQQVAWCHALPGTNWLMSGLEFIVFGLLVFEFKLLSHDLPISIPVLVGEHILHDHFSIKTRSELPFASCHLGMNVL